MNTLAHINWRLCPSLTWPSMDNKLFEKTRPIPRPTVDSEREIKVYCWFSNLILSRPKHRLSVSAVWVLYQHFINSLSACRIVMTVGKWNWFWTGPNYPGVICLSRRTRDYEWSLRCQLCPFPRMLCGLCGCGRVWDVSDMEWGASSVTWGNYTGSPSPRDQAQCPVAHSFILITHYNYNYNTNRFMTIKGSRNNEDSLPSKKAVTFGPHLWSSSSFCWLSLHNQFMIGLWSVCICLWECCKPVRS